VAEWLEQKLGVVVPELDHERTESIPFSEQAVEVGRRAERCGANANAVFERRSSK
jgi:hypothetical protein